MACCLVIEHVEPERPYAIGDSLESASVEVRPCRTYKADQLPEHIDGFDGLVVMGGPMSAMSDEGFATRRNEVELLAEAVQLGVPTLGMCLGAQLLATASGGQVTAGGAGPEIGWRPVRFSDSAGTDPLFAGVPKELTVLHWHGDTYELPPGAMRLASSSLYPEQAFRIGHGAWGLQFHIEVNEAAVEAFLEAFGQDATEAGTTPNAIQAATPDAVAQLLPHRDKILRRFASLVTARARRSRTEAGEEAALDDRGY